MSSVFCEQDCLIKIIQLPVLQFQCSSQKNAAELHKCLKLYSSNVLLYVVLLLDCCHRDNLIAVSFLFNCNDYKHKTNCKFIFNLVHNRGIKVDRDSVRLSARQDHEYAFIFLGDFVPWQTKWHSEREVSKEPISIPMMSLFYSHCISISIYFQID